MAVKQFDQLRPERAAAGLRVSAYDRTFSLLIALLLLVGGAVLGIVIVFFSNRLTRLPPAIPVTPVSASSSSASDGEVNELTPGVENAPESIEPDLEELLEQVSLAATSDAVLMAEEASADSAAMNKGDSGGDTRGVGPAGDGDLDAREPRREIRFEPASVDEYAEWFDKAGLEIAVLGSDNVVYYASRLSTPEPVIRTGNPDDDKRLYFNSTGGPLHPLDRRLAEKAGILNRGTLVLQFCTAATQRKLLELEKQAADGRPTRDIARTVFRVVKRGSGYDFEVEEQQFYR
ncbi:MAG: hypothetical protein AAF266_09475 [Planctomycetota bacterium]